MQLPSPLSLLLFLQLVARTRAAPIPLSDCLHYASCDPSLRNLVSELSFGQRHHTPPPTKLTTPHFPAHQLDNLPRPSPKHPALPPHPTNDEDEENFNNAPVTPPPSISPSNALSAEVPLQSSYLLSMSQNRPPTRLESLAAKPTSALPLLRKEDLRRYREELAKIIRKPSGRIQKEHKMIMHGHVEPMSAPKCMHMRILNIEEGRGAWKASQAREYSDVIVVGIVVLFLCAVVVVEAVEKLADLRQAVFGLQTRQGAIRLEEGDNLFIVKKPFCLQPAPPPKYKIRSLRKGTLQTPQMFSDDEESDVLSFKYDSDATEKV